MNDNRAPAPRLHGVTGTSASTPWDVAVIIPARNEARRIQPCLQALADAIDRSPVTAGVILCVNDTQDDTAGRGTAILQMRGVSHLVLDMEFPAGSGGVGRTRDLGCKLSQRIAGQPSVIMTTDADSRVAPDWIIANLKALEAADIVFGAIIPDPEELSLLRPQLACHDTIEEDYARAAVRLVSALDPVPHDPDPRHLRAAGASIALTARALQQLGGIPWCRLSEDRALAARAEAMDLRIRHASEPQVITSCRLNGRAEGGMASTLRERCTEADPYCDAWLEPAEDMITRYEAKGRLRAVWPSVAKSWTVVQRVLGAGPVPNPNKYDCFGAFWQSLEATHPALARRRLRHSEAARDLPVLLAHLDLIHPRWATPMPDLERVIHAP
ncbi:MAG: glycosyltransferase family 2 protein [Rhodobacterales bacterium]|nr:glycosyltransferase family 2 protein [Rhodobacterales bacterium]MDX5414041.1 glycosyltransferase family 2 protein [Rhodobacterales bacterium]